MSVLYRAGDRQIICELEPPRRNPPKRIRLRFRAPPEQPIRSVAINDKPWTRFQADWVDLPPNPGASTILVTY
jgi:hypothetical protein